MNRDTITLPRSVVEQALKALYEADSLMEHHTNIELRRSALVELRAALEQPQVEQEPVAWQRRMRTKWMQDNQWWPWQECSKEVADDYKRAPVVNDWEYESRALYTHPQPPRQPLTDEQIRAMWCQFAPVIGGPLDFARAIERFHGIGGAA